MHVGIFYSSINNPHKFPHKTAVMDSFAQGVLAHGDTVDCQTIHGPIPDVDVGFVLGYTLENTYRRTIIDTLINRNKRIIYVDSNIFSYGRSAHQYHRYSVDSVYPTTGQYLLAPNLDYSKWDRISAFHKIQLKPWRDTGKHILVLAQRTKSWNMLGKNGLDWTLNIVTQIQGFTTRRIIVRLHPGDKKHDQVNRTIIKQHFNDTVHISTNEDIRHDLANAWCCVGYNSTPNCVSAIEGVPVYIDDPENSWATDVAFTNIAQIDYAPLPDRTEWIHKIANIHWSNQEIASGEYWGQFKEFYK